MVGPAYPRLNRYESILTGTALAGFLIFPSLGIVQKYLGTTGALAYLVLGLLLLGTVGANGLARRLIHTSEDRRRISWTLVALYVVLVAAFLILYPVVNAHARPGMLDGAVAAAGSDRDESLALGVSALLARRYPYSQMTYLNNPVTQLPGSLLLAVPFALLGNAVWQNLFWLAALIAVTTYLFECSRLAIAFLALVLLGSPAVLQDFVTGGDLGVNAIAVLVGMVSIVRLAPDASVKPWKKIAVAVFTGIALSSRLNYLLLVPPLFAAVARRAGLRDGAICLIAIAFAFTAVTLPFYWRDPAGFAPLHLHNKFVLFDDEVPSSGMLFPALSLLSTVVIALYPGNQTLSGWLMQCGLVMAIPVLFLVALATIRSHTLDFAFTSYALASVFFGGMGAGLKLGHPEAI